LITSFGVDSLYLHIKKLIDVRQTAMKNDHGKLKSEDIEIFDLTDLKLHEIQGSFITPLSFLAQLWQRSIEYFSNANEIQVWQKLDRLGNIYWQAYDPVTGRSTCSGSELEIRAWIEQFYRGSK